MALKVCKFGGTSVADAAQLRRVQAIVRADPARRFVVTSAPGKRGPGDQKVTDLLYLCHEHQKRGVAFDDVFRLIGERYGQIARELELGLDLDSLLAEVRRQITAGAGPDYTASRGELLGFEFVDPADIVVFDARGRFVPEETQARVAARLSNAGPSVIAGYYGAMPDGRIKTFSRGGSDVSGAIVARGVGADVYENWTDVSGLLMADPRIVDNPKKIETLTYRELRELAYMGATVLHDEAIFPVRQAGIPVNIRNTNAPDDPGTMILRSDRELPVTGDITGVAGRRGFSILAIEKTLMNTEVGFGRRVLSVLERHGVSFEHMPSGIDTMGVVVSTDALNGSIDVLRREIEAECHPDAFEVHGGIALIATVGRGMMYAPGMAARIMTALANARVNIRMIDQGSGELNVIVGVREEDFEKAVRAIYTAFVHD
jgi:aspartate kinase